MLAGSGTRASNSAEPDSTVPVRLIVIVNEEEEFAVRPAAKGGIVGVNVPRKARMRERPGIIEFPSTRSAWKAP